MKIVKAIILVLLVLMSAAAGAAKVFQTPQETAFFESVGLSAFWLLPLGVVQIAGALAAIVHQTRRIGMAFVAAGFLVSAIIIFMTGNIGFGLISLLPVLLAAAISFYAAKETEVS